MKRFFKFCARIYSAYERDAYYVKKDIEAQKRILFLEDLLIYGFGTQEEVYLSKEIIISEVARIEHERMLLTKQQNQLSNTFKKTL